MSAVNPDFRKVRESQLAFRNDENLGGGLRSTPTTFMTQVPYAELDLFARSGSPLLVGCVTVVWSSLRSWHAAASAQPGSMP
jgi:hypothetical protein